MFKRYIDIDIHHGDGVEEAFYTSDRVMTCSFHKYGEFFPGKEVDTFYFFNFFIYLFYKGTGDIRDTGYDKGKNYSVNVPLADGINDESYLTIFKPVISAIMEHFNPQAVVLQVCNREWSVLFD